MPIPVLLAGVLKGLAANGLGVLAGALQAKGKEWVEDKLGVKIPDDASGLTGDKLLELKKAEMEFESVLVQAALEDKRLDIEAGKSAGIEVTERWKSDMTSDSWLSKNIRPLTLVYLLVAYTVFALMSAFGLDVNEAYVTLLGQWGMLVMSAYFVGRSVEKGIDMVQRYRALKDTRVAG